MTRLLALRRHELSLATLQIWAEDSRWLTPDSYEIPAHVWELGHAQVVRIREGRN